MIAFLSHDVLTESETNREERRGRASRLSSKKPHESKEDLLVLVDLARRALILGRRDVRREEDDVPLGVRLL